ncbi:uncharacterized protein BT62DRAFT_1078578 [Guyanagaster necrorhizus]|uniref:P-loop containing nucleoside triphosphate hydrolase protein n=1 Tax=Guyanagaster necrorhizus TaxID=856835 RepID=A0A9P8APQ5_9AGAR|nr:uncharacterized protein BT62DRAFT_1078578 [Guyanagaster necrorhizus MCA 3950]KAG7443195.1 hypothetical protein BT62DRAFT_1078578 [Guyanagaster necrorhizus MCA 3950]
MDALKSLVQPLVGGAAGSSVIDGMKLVVLGGTVETARRVTFRQLLTSGVCPPRVQARRIQRSYGTVVYPIPLSLEDAVGAAPAFFLTAHFSEEDYPYDWLMLWLSRQPEWQRSREFETTTRSSSGFARTADNSFGDEEDEDDEEDEPGRVKTRVVFQPTFDTTHTIFYRGHWLRIRRGRKNDGSGCEVLSISVVARNNSILKQLVLQAKREYEAEAVHRIQIYFADSHGSWRWTDSRHKRPMGSIVLNPGVKEMLLGDTRDFLKSEQWYADRGIPFRRGYLLHGVPGSGKSSLIHAIAGELMLDIYVVSLSSSWISDKDLDAAFTRSVSRDKNSSGNPEGNNNEGDNDQTNTTTPAVPSTGRRRHQRDQLSDVNTLSLSGLLNALDGVAAAEGRLLFATTNHLERLDPALSRPGRMDVWIEFKNASKWQAEALFRNFFPSVEEPAASCDGAPPPGSTLSDMDEAELEGINIPSPPQTPSSGSSTLWSLSPSFASSTSSLPPSPKNNSSATSKSSKVLPQFGANNQAYLPPPVEEHIASSQHSAKPLDGAKLALLAKKFADAIPEEEFSVAALQGYLLKHKSNPDKAADEAAEWVVSEREMKVRLQVEKEKREKEEKERKDKKKKDKEDEKKKQLELEKEELEKLKKELKEREEKDKEREQAAAAAAAETEVQAPVMEEAIVIEVPTPPPEPEPEEQEPEPEPVAAAVEDTNSDSDSDNEEEDVLPELVVQTDELVSAWTSPPTGNNRESGSWTGMRVTSCEIGSLFTCLGSKVCCSDFAGRIIVLDIDVHGAARRSHARSIVAPAALAWINRLGSAIIQSVFVIPCVIDTDTMSPPGWRLDSRRRVSQGSDGRITIQKHKTYRLTHIAINVLNHFPVAKADISFLINDHNSTSAAILAKDKTSCTRRDTDRRTTDNPDAGFDRVRSGDDAFTKQKQSLSLPSPSQHSNSNSDPNLIQI